MSQTSSRKPLQKILVVLSSLAFIGSAVFGLAGMFTQPQQNTSQTQDTESARLTQLKQQQQGFESVLKREPNNQTALQGIADIKLQLKDFKGAIPYIEKLVKLNPKQPSYQALLAEVKKQAKDGNVKKQ
jgi:cytochrome c-type biogenesis protein CcmH/NrfG